MAPRAVIAIRAVGPDALRLACAELRDAGAATATFDLGQLADCDDCVAVLDLIARLHLNARRQHAIVRFSNVSTTVRALLVIVGLDEIVLIVPPDRCP